MHHSPRLVLLGGGLLAFGAAFANTGVFLEAGASISHLTGDISRLSIDLAKASSADTTPEIARVLTAALSFLLGAGLGGLLIHHPVLDLARPYGRTICGIGVMLIAAAWWMPRQPVGAIGLSALACGLQNSLATRYRGLVLRTTHLTGLFTDLGVNLGMRLRGYDIPGWKIAVPTLLIGAFFAGGILAGWVALENRHDPLLLGGIGYLVAGLAWTVLKHVIRPAFLEPHPGIASERERGVDE